LHGQDLICIAQTMFPQTQHLSEAYCEFDKITTLADEEAHENWGLTTSID